MPFCPKCNKKYDKDTIICPDCKDTLVEENESNYNLRKSTKVFSKKEDTYKDQRSTGIMLLVFSILGLIFLALNIAGVFHFFNGIFNYCLIGALFLGFLIASFSCFKSAKEAAKGMDAENKLTDDIHAFLTEYVTTSSFDEPDWSNLSNELLFYKRTDKLKALVNEKFGTQDDAYLDCIIEEFYDINF